jgi:hypothetical protein
MSDTIEDLRKMIEQLQARDDEIAEVFNEQAKLLGEWTGTVQMAIDNHGRRLNVVEAIMTHPDLAEERKKLADGTLSMDDFARVYKDIVAPQLEAQFRRMMEERQAKLKDAESKIVKAGPPEGTILGPDGNPAVAKGNVVKFPS